MKTAFGAAENVCAFVNIANAKIIKNIEINNFFILMLPPK